MPWLVFLIICIAEQSLASTSLQYVKQSLTPIYAKPNGQILDYAVENEAITILTPGKNWSRVKLHKNLEGYIQTSTLAKNKTAECRPRGYCSFGYKDYQSPYLGFKIAYSEKAAMKKARAQILKHISSTPGSKAADVNDFKNYFLVGRVPKEDGIKIIGTESENVMNYLRPLGFGFRIHHKPNPAGGVTGLFPLKPVPATLIVDKTLVETHLTALNAQSDCGPTSYEIVFQNLAPLKNQDLAVTCFHKPKCGVVLEKSKDINGYQLYFLKESRQSKPNFAIVLKPGDDSTRNYEILYVAASTPSGWKWIFVGDRTQAETTC